MEKESIKTIWDRIEAGLAKYALPVLENLNPGASSAQINKAEKQIGVEFSQDLKESLAIHNGQSTLSNAFSEDWQLLSTEDIVSQWKINQDVLKKGDFGDNKAEPDGPVKPVWWNSRWVPVAYNGSDLICADMDPPEKGTPGQLIVFYHASEKRLVIAESLSAWMKEYANDVEAGRYSLKEGVFHKTKKGKGRNK